MAHLIIAQSTNAISSESKSNENDNNSNNVKSNCYTLENFFSEGKGFNTDGPKLIDLVTFEVTTIEQLLATDTNFENQVNVDLEQRMCFVLCFGLEIAVK